MGVSIWDPRDRSLFLAKDFIGTRHLYYSVEKDHVTWCTILDPLVLFADHSFETEEEYVAGWLSCFPAPHLTPYVAIRSVPPSSFVRLTRGVREIRQVLGISIPASGFVIGSDVEYEEQFRIGFFPSCSQPTSFGLSGASGTERRNGFVLHRMCADKIIAANRQQSCGSDTLSYYNDFEPTGMNALIFAKWKSGGAELDVTSTLAAMSLPGSQPRSDKILLTPASLTRIVSRAKLFPQCIEAQNNESCSPAWAAMRLPAASLLLPPNLRTSYSWQSPAMVRQLKGWALSKRKPWFHLLFEISEGFSCQPCLEFPNNYSRPHGCLWNSKAAYRYVLHGYENRLKLFRFRPSFQESQSNLDAVRRQLSCFIESAGYPYEKRYPFLDRDLLEFLFSVLAHSFSGLGSGGP